MQIICKFSSTIEILWAPSLKYQYAGIELLLNGFCCFDLFLECWDCQDISCITSWLYNVIISILCLCKCYQTPKNNFYFNWMKSNLHKTHNNKKLVNYICKRPASEVTAFIDVSYLKLKINILSFNQIVFLNTVSSTSKRIIVFIFMQYRLKVLNAMSKVKKIRETNFLF